MSVRELLLEWYYARFQAVSRAQGRYMLLLLIASAFGVSLHLTTDYTANVAFLGISVPKPVLNATTVLVLGVLLLAFLGTFPAMKQAFENLLARMGDHVKDGEHVKDTEVYFIDQHPNVADFLSYATLVEGKEGPLTRPSVLVLYPLPMWVFAGCAVALWWLGVKACPCEPRWLVWLYRFDAVVVFLAVLRAAGETRRFWRGQRTKKRIGGAS